MKRANTTRRFLLLLLIGAGAMLMAAACTNPVLGVLTAMTSKSYGLTGRWMNSSAMNGYLPQAYWLILNSDGTMQSRDGGGATTNNGTYTVNSVSVSGDSRSYQIAVSSAYYYYCLVKVSGGTKLEIQTSYSSYPPSINPADSANYGVYTAQ